MAPESTSGDYDLELNLHYDIAMDRCWILDAIKAGQECAGSIQRFMDDVKWNDDRLKRAREGYAPARAESRKRAWFRRRKQGNSQLSIDDIHVLDRYLDSLRKNRNVLHPSYGKFSSARLIRNLSQLRDKLYKLIEQSTQPENHEHIIALLAGKRINSEIRKDPEILNAVAEITIAMADTIDEEYDAIIRLISMRSAS